MSEKDWGIFLVSAIKMAYHSDRTRLESAFNENTAMNSIQKSIRSLKLYSCGRFMVLIQLSTRF